MEARLRPSSPQRTSEPIHQPADNPAAPRTTERTGPVETTTANFEGPGQDQRDAPLETLGFGPNMDSLHAGDSFAPERESSPGHQGDLFNFEAFMFNGDAQLDDGGGSVRSLTEAKTIPDELRALLVDHYFRVIHPIFPIIREQDFRERLNGNVSGHDDSDQLSFVLYALLAVAVSCLKSTHPISEDPRLRAYDSVNLGDLFYSYATTEVPLFLSNTKPGLNSVIGHGLLSLYLAESGKAYEAWVTTGHAIRLYEGLDLRDDAATGQDPRIHRNIWWCLYVLDRSLSTVLLKPLAIDDAEYDLDDKRKPSTHETHPEMEFWFSVIVDFHIIMGRIYKSVRSIRKAARSSTPNLEDKMRASVRQHDAELEEYFTDKVLPWMEESPRIPEAAALQTVAVSSYYASLILLHRAFLETYTMAEPATLLRCAEAASCCIKLTPRLVATVPASHFLIQQGRAVFAGAKVLLHCVRMAWNPTFTAKALSDVEAGIGMLQRLGIQWPEIEKYQVLIQEEMQSTKAELERRDKISETFGRFGHASSNITLCLDRLPGLNALPTLAPSTADQQRHSQQRNYDHCEAVESTVQNNSSSIGTQHDGPSQPSAKRPRREDGDFQSMGAMEHPLMEKISTNAAADGNNSSPITLFNFQPPVLSPGAGALSAGFAANDFMISSLNHFDLLENE